MKESTLGSLIVIEGIDGAGKGTQASRLTTSLAEAGRRAALVSFPRYSDTLFGEAIGDFLNGRFGSLAEVHPQLASLLYAGDRFESKDYLCGLLQSNDVVVCDRYVPSNIAHQAGKLSGAPRERLSAWIQQVEHDVFGLPRPDLVILLDLPVAQAQRQIAAKAKRDYTDAAADLQERDGEYLEGVRKTYLNLADDDPNWVKIACADDTSVRSIEEIAREVLQTVTERGPH